MSAQSLASTATHSLRKGGALFYARHGAPEDATRQQGGWRTTEVMKLIYTKLSPTEVDAAISNVVRASSLQIQIRRKIKALGNSAEEVLANPSAALMPFLDFLQHNYEHLDEVGLMESRISPFLNLLIKHDAREVRELSTRLHTLVRSMWAAVKAAKRQRVA